MNNLELNPPRYPPTKEKKVEEYCHGVKITDFYRWMENLNDPYVQKWLKEQNQYTREILERIEEKKVFEKRLTELFSIEEISIPIESEIGVFYLKRFPTEQQPVLYFRSKSNPFRDETLIDVNKIDPNGLTSLDWWVPSQDGKFLAYGISENGSEWATLQIMNVSSKTILEDKIERARYCILSWDKNNTGFYYTKFPKKGEVPKGEEQFHSHIRHHKIGSNPDHDLIIFKNPKKPYEYPIYEISPDRTFMIVQSHRFTAVDLYYIDLTTSPPKINPILINSNWMIQVLISKKYVFFISNHESSKFGLYRSDRSNLDLKSWQCIIKPNDKIIEGSKLVGDKLIILWLKDVKNRITIHNQEGIFEKELSIPKDGSITFNFETTEFDNLFLQYQSYYIAPKIYCYNIKTATLNLFYEKKLLIDKDKFIVKDVWYKSLDKTKVHMFILHKSELGLKKNNPTILYGYGGFGINLTPTFSSSFITWLEAGGVIAIANIRGGGENGDDWHKAGRLEKKQAVFDDFIAAAEYLINEGYCTSQSLGIYGASNGGLLVGAVMIQRPDLFEAVYCSVPLLDMIRYHHFSLGKTWIPEYGNPDNFEDFKWIYKYSPYQNIKDKVKYPSVFFYTAESDTRVEPIHAIKMCPALRKASVSNKPILFWYEYASGHGVGIPVRKLIQTNTDMLSFFHWRLFQKDQ